MHALWRHKEVGSFWVKAHIGTAANEAADRLGKAGALFIDVYALPSSPRDQ